MTPLLALACVGAFGAACAAFPDKDALPRIDPATTTSIVIDEPTRPNLVERPTKDPKKGQAMPAKSRLEHE